MGHAKMVGWYDPGQLARTGAKVVVSTLFGENADFRIIEALAANQAEAFYDHTVEWRTRDDDGEEPDPSRPRSGLWIDYVGDLGGWSRPTKRPFRPRRRRIRTCSPFRATTIGTTAWWPSRGSSA